MVVREVNAAASDGAPAVTSLHVANLDAKVTDSQLYDLFSQIGDVVSVKLCRNPHSGLSLGYGFVNYANPQCAQRALEELNFTPVNGKPIKIMCSHKEPTINKLANIYIKNLDKEIDHKDLHDIFSPFGNILSCKVAKDASGQSMGYGFVQFAGEDSARKAIVELHGMPLNGNQVYVGFYLSKQERKLLADKANFTRVFVKNFCEATTEDDLKCIFGEFGLITSTVVMRNGDGTSKCFGFVNFANSNDAARAIECLNGQIFNEKKWYVGRAQMKFERLLEMKHHLECVKGAFDKGSNLYVKNLDDGIDDDNLKELFSPFGSVTSCVVVRDKKGISTGRGFVAYSSPEEASRALSEMNGKILGSKPFYVALAQRKDERRAGKDKEIDHKALHETLLSSCKLSTDASNQSMDYGHAQSGGADSAQKAIGELNSIVGELNSIVGELNGIIGGLNGITGGLKSMLMNGKQVCAGPFPNKKEKKMLVYKANCTNVFVENFWESTSEDDLKNIFGEFGLITSTVVMRNEDGTSKGFGFVNFENAEDATRAIKSLNGQIFDRKEWCSGRAQKRQHVVEAVDKGSNLYVNKPLYVALAKRKEDVRAQLQNLDKEIDRKALPKSFLSSQDTPSCKVATDASGQSMGSDFVQFSSEEYAQKAIEEHNGLPLNEKQGRVGSFLSKEEKELPIEKANFTNVFVKNFHESTSEDKLKNIFCEFGAITSTVVMRNVDGDSKCFGFVSFEKAEDAARAIESLNGQKFDNKKWYVGRAQREFKRELELKHRAEQCVIDAVNKRSNLYVNILNDSSGGRKLSEVFSPSRSVKSGKVMQDKKGIYGGSGLGALSPPVQASRALSEINGKILVGKPVYAAAFARRKVNGRAPLQDQPGFGHQEQLLPGMRSARPLMMNMFSPKVQLQQHGSCTVGRPTTAGPMEKVPQPAPAMSQQILPRGCACYYPPGGDMYSVGGFPLCGEGMSQPIPVGPLASSLAIASQLGRGR